MAVRWCISMLIYYALECRSKSRTSLANRFRGWSWRTSLNSIAATPHRWWWGTFHCHSSTLTVAYQGFGAIFPLTMLANAASNAFFVCGCGGHKWDYKGNRPFPDDKECTRERFMPKCYTWAPWGSIEVWKNKLCTVPGEFRYLVDVVKQYFTMPDLPCRHRSLRAKSNAYRLSRRIVLCHLPHPLSRSRNGRTISTGWGQWKTECAPSLLVE